MASHTHTLYHPPLLWRLWCILQLLHSAPKPWFPQGPEILVAEGSQLIPSLGNSFCCTTWGQYISYNQLMGVGRIRGCVWWEGHKGPALYFNSRQIWGAVPAPENYVGWTEASAEIALKFIFSLLCVLLSLLPYKCCYWEYSTINHFYANLWLRNVFMTTSKATSSKHLIQTK